MNNNRTCQQCGYTIRGRSDKRFCDDTCRNKYHNRVNTTDDHLIRQVNSVLKRNRRILKSICPDDMEYLNCEKNGLAVKGFQFGYHTHGYSGEKGMYYHFCYEFSYAFIGEGDQVMVRRHPKILPSLE